LKQLVRYAVVGIATNLAGYAVYLLVTWAGVEPKLAMTCLYALGATVSFLGNRSWTFAHRGNIATGAVRFAIAHLLGYLLNLTLLVVFVDRLGFPHQLVQGAAILIVALFLFALFRAFVFPGGRRPAGP
jgi:putative flippase GtrA